MGRQDMYVSAVAKLGLLFAACMILPIWILGGRGATRDVRGWSLDLSQDPDYLARQNSAHPEMLRRPELHFLDSKTLVLAFDDYNPWAPSFRPMHSSPSAASKKNEKRNFAFRAIFLESDSGSEIRRLRWETRDNHSQLLPTKDGGFIVLAAGSLNSYDANAHLLAEEVLSAKEIQGSNSAGTRSGTIGNSESDLWQVQVAPGGKIFVLAHTVRKSTLYEWRGTKDLKPIATVEGYGYGNFSCSEEQIVRTFSRDVSTASKGTEFKPLCPGCKGYRSSFLDNDHLVLVSPHKFTVMHASGVKVADGKLENTVQLLDASIATDKFAIGSTEPDSRHWTLKVRIVDWKSGKIMNELKFEKDAPMKDPSEKMQVDTGFNQWALALSPDGSRLALLRDDVLEIEPLE